MNTILLISTVVFAFFVCWLLIPIIIKLADKHRLYDQPDARKVHTRPTARLGGVGIFAAFLLPAVLIVMQAANLQSKLVFLSASLLFILGLVDDRLDLSARIKFFVQIAAALIIAGAGIRINSFYGLFGIDELNLEFQYFVTVLFIVLITNAFNLIDGIDGLSGGLSLINLIVLGVILHIVNQPFYGMMSFALAGAVFGFLLFNFAPAKIFMGDSGSLVLGFLQASFGVVLIGKGSEMYLQSDLQVNYLVMTLGIFMVPAYDLLRVFIRRIISRKSPFSPDKTHIHHLLLATGLNHKKSSLILYSANALIILTAWLSGGMEVLISIGVMLVITLLANELLNIRRLILLSVTNKSLQLKVKDEALANRFLVQNKKLNF